MECVGKNQFTKAREQGKEPPRGTNQFMKAREKGLPMPEASNQFKKRTAEGKRIRTEQDQVTRDKIRAEKALQLLDREARGEIKLDNGRRKSCEIILEYGKSKIAATPEPQARQALTDEEAQASIAKFPEMAAALPIANGRAILRAIIAAHPALLQEIAIRPADAAAKTA